MDISQLFAFLRRRGLLALGVFTLIMAAQGVYLRHAPRTWSVDARVRLVEPELRAALASVTATRQLGPALPLLLERTRREDFASPLVERFGADAAAALRTFQFTADDKTRTTRVALRTARPEMAREMLDAIIASLAEDYTQDLRRELDDMRRDLEAQDRALSARRSAVEGALLAMLADASRGYVPRTFEEELAALENQITSLAKDAVALQDQEQQLALKIKSRERTLPIERLIAQLGNSPVAEILKKRLTGLVETYGELLEELQTKTELYPDVITLRRRLEARDAQIAALITPDGELFPYVAAVYQGARDRLIDEAEAEARSLAAIRKARREAAAVRERLSASAAQLRGNRPRYMDLYQEYTVLRARSTSLASALDELDALERTTAACGLKIAVPPGTPVDEDRLLTKVLYLGVVLALVGAFGVCYGFEVLDQRMHGVQALAARFKAPLLGVLPWGADAAAPRDAEVIAQKLEEYAAPPLCVVVTGAHERAGVTTTSRALARAAAARGRRVLLVECSGGESREWAPGMQDGVTSLLSGRHLRRRRLAAAFAGRREFTELALMTDAGSAEGLPAVETDVDGMHVMPFGGLPADALHSATGLAALVRETKKRYDLVVCDAPPAHASPRATLLGRAADGVVLVVRRGRTTAQAIEQVLRAWDGTGLSFYGFVLNGTRAAAGERGAHRRRCAEVVPV